MSAEKVRVITTTEQVITGREDIIVFNSAGAINFNLGPSYGDGRRFELKNIGAGAVTLVPDGSDVIWEDSSVTTKVLNQGESISITDAVAETWISSYTDFETTPLGEGGTGITGTGVTSVFYVDNKRTDSYTQDGSILRPYKTLTALLIVINADSLIKQAAATYTTACYVVNVAAGTYTDNIALGNVKSLRFNLDPGVYLTGNITYTTTMVGGTADNYYSRLEFIGVAGNRPEKGPAGRITGTFTATRNNDSLSYVSFSGIDIQGAMSFATNGTWVVAMHNVMLQARMSCADSAIALLETTGHCIITGHLAAAADAVTAISLYNCDNTEFDLIHISNGVGSRVTNCRFNSNVTVTGGTFAVDANSYKSAIAQTENFTGATLSHLDNIGLQPSPLTRTVGQLVAANTVNDNIDLLDTAIGADSQLTAVARTTGPVAVANSVYQNVDALDSAIGFEAQMSGTPHVVTFPTTVFQALDKLDTYKSVQTVKKTVGGVGVAGCDFNFATAANTDEQVINLGAIVPAKARIVDVFTFTDAVFTGATSLVADVGTTSGGGELIGSATIYAANAITAAPNAGAFIATPSASATSIYLNATPGANWSNVTAGKVSVYVTFINVTNI